MCVKGIPLEIIQYLKSLKPISIRIEDGDERGTVEDDI